MIEVKDAKLPNDVLTAKIREETHGDLVEISIDDSDVSSIATIDITKENAVILGEYLIRLGESNG